MQVDQPISMYGECVKFYSQENVRPIQEKAQP